MKNIKYIMTYLLFAICLLNFDSKILASSSVESISNESESFRCEELTDEYFKKYEIDENNEYIRKSDLRKLSITVMGFDGKPHEKTLVTAYQFAHPETGEIINVADEVLEIFKELYDAKFPIERASCFNFRPITGKNALSDHALGLAVDINYEKNPYVKYDKNGEIISIIPDNENSHKCLDRSIDEKGMIKSDGPCVSAFKKRGWFWGGDWTDPKDYMHFQRFKAGWKKQKRYPLDSKKENAKKIEKSIKKHKAISWKDLKISSFLTNILTGKIKH